MHNLVLGEGSKGAENLNEEFDGLLFRKRFVFFKVLREIAFVAVLEDKVEVVGCFLDVIEFNDVLVVTGPQYFDLVFE